MRYIVPKRFCPSEFRLLPWLLGIVAALLLSEASLLPLPGQDMVRSVRGTVTDENGKPLKGVPVQMKNLRSLEIRSFLTKDNGEFYFHGLSTDIDYELHAKYRNHMSSTKMLSKFDSRKDAVVDLKIDTGG
jgi:hypothetical protein